MSETNKKIKIQNESGIVEDYDILNSFELTDISKKFLIYHKNEIINGIHKIYVSEIDDKEPGIIVLNNIEDDVLWARVKEILKIIGNL